MYIYNLLFLDESGLRLTDTSTSSTTRQFISMEYAPRYTQPFTLEEATSFDVTVIVEGSTTILFPIVPTQLV